MLVGCGARTRSDKEVEMKLRVFSIVLGLSVVASWVQARFYLGINADYSAQVMSAPQKSGRALSIHPSDVISDSLREGQRGYSFDMVLGAEDFYSRYFGTRYGVGAGYTRFGQLKFIDIELSFDFLLDFFNNRDFGIGIFGGMSVDHHYGFAHKEHFFNLDGRIGTSILILANHRIEAFAKLPIASIKMGSKPSLLARTTFGASYKMIF